MSAPACTIRFGQPDDIPTIFSLIKGLAEYERLSDAVVGNEELLHVTTNNRDLVAIVDSSQRVQPGQNVTLNVPLEKVYLFDPESGLSLDKARQPVAA